MSYPDVYTLIQKDTKARQFYNKLPTYVKDQICTRAESVNSLESLMDYADNLTRGDG